MGQGGDGSSKQIFGGGGFPVEEFSFQDEQLERMVIHDIVRDNGGGVVDPDVAFRREMAAAFAQAIQEAEEARTAVSADQSNAALAQMAHDKVLYDFPILTDLEVHALAATLHSNLMQRKELGFPLSTSFVSGVSYLTAPRTAPTSSELPAASGDTSAPLATMDVTAGGRAEPVGSATRASLDTIAACALVKLPAVLLSAAGSDRGASLRKAFAAYHPLGAAKGPLNAQGEGQTLEQHFTESATESPGTKTPELSAAEDGYQMAEEMDDDEYEFEPIEDETACIPSHFGPGSLPASHGSDDGTSSEESATWQSLLARLAELASQARHERLAGAAVWKDLRLAEDVAGIVASLMTLPTDEPADVHVHGTVHVMRLYTDLLCEHLVLHPGSGLSTSEGVGPAVRALLQATTGGTPGGGSGRNPAGVLRREARNVALHALATLAVRIGSADADGPAPGPSSASRQRTNGGVPRGDGGARSLWPGLRDALPFLAECLATSAGSQRGVGSESAEVSADVEMAMHALQFLVKWAPVNTDIGQPLLQSGIFRDAVQLFVKCGSAPANEALRRFLVMAAAAAPSLAGFASAVPPFAKMVASESFTSRGTLVGIHGAIWPLVLRARVAATAGANGDNRDASEALVADALVSYCSLLREPKIVDSHVGNLAVDGMWVHHLLVLLLEVGTIVKRSCNTPRHSLWRAGGPVSRSLAQLQLALRHVSRAGVLTSSSGDSVVEDVGSSPRGDAGAHEGSGDGRETSGGKDEAGERAPVDEEDEKVHGEVNAGRKDEKEAAREKIEDLIPKMEKVVKQLREQERGDADGKSD